MSAGFAALMIGPAAIAGGIAATDGVLAGVLAVAAAALIGAAILMPRGNPTRGALTHDRDASIDLLGAALNNMPQGVALYDKFQRLLLVNPRYAEMYGLAAGDVKIGMSLKQVLDKRAKKGVFIGDDARRYVDGRVEGMRRSLFGNSVERFADGRVIGKSRQPLPNGGWLSVHEDISERQRAEDRVAFMAHHDVLTGLHNRAVLPAKIDDACAWVRRHGGELAVLTIDIDAFKIVNDSLGHASGDKVLRAVAGRLRAAARETDVVARVAGDEFVVVCGFGASDAGAVAAMANRLIETIGAPYDIDGCPVVIAARVGAAVAPTDGLDAETLLRNASLALVQAKQSGASDARFFNSRMDTALREERSLEADLRLALAANQFEVHYQAVVGVVGNQVTGMEALVRWRHPRLGMVPPDRFIKIAEKTGCIDALGEWVLATACREARNWPEDVRVAVNLSPSQFKSGDLVNTVWRCLLESGLPARRLTLEITESTLLEKTRDNLKILQELKELDVSIALDDFGTGYSSLSYLKTIPFDVIKIDRSFVKEMATDERSARIVAGIVALSTSLDFTTVAEGIETEEQLQLVRAAGCDAVQGFLFARPKPASELEFGEARPQIVKKAA